MRGLGAERTRRDGWGGRTRTSRWRLQRPLPYQFGDAPGSAARRDRHPAWRPPNGGRSRLPSFRRLRDPGPDRRGEGRAGQRAGRFARLREDPEDRRPAAREADRSRPQRPQPLAQRRDRRAEPLGRPAARSLPRSRPSSGSKAAGSRSGRASQAANTDAVESGTPGFTSRHASGAKSESGSDPLADPADARGTRGEEVGHVGAEREREPGERLRPRAHPESSPPGRAARLPRRSSRRRARPPLGIRLVKRIVTARASPAAARKPARGPHRQIGRVRGHPGRRARERELDVGREPQPRSRARSRRPDRGARRRSRARDSRPRGGRATRRPRLSFAGASDVTRAPAAPAAGFTTRRAPSLGRLLGDSTKRRCSS